MMTDGALVMYDDNIVMMIHLLHNLLLHEVHAHGEQRHAKYAIGHCEHHLHGSHGVVLKPVERLDGGVVAEADGGEGDKAEVGGGGGRPFQRYHKILISK